MQLVLCKHTIWRQTLSACYRHNWTTNNARTTWTLLQQGKHTRDKNLHIHTENYHYSMYYSTERNTLHNIPAPIYIQDTASHLVAPHQIGTWGETISHTHRIPSYAHQPVRYSNSDGQTESLSLLAVWRCWPNVVEPRLILEFECWMQPRSNDVMRLLREEMM